ncbi:phospholipase D family protein [Neisseria montereyensis]|uniref:Phospholipase D family protein n=1 Tax=Neisseria montereyensis TaxID=2973938 RepID=A0ABT2FB65_9NEIS|nr:phospholipase D family protein [Neisseria montereyensis]MCS4533206.1 phospholipase D family protein [Neisseria montereyensis]
MKPIYLICLMFSFLLSGCLSLPSLENRTVSTYLDIPPSSKLVDTLKPLSPEKDGLEAGMSGIYMLDDAHDAFVARATLIDSAEYTLDLQYYIWHNDVSGKILFNMLHRAAERGVRVRLLLDDNNTNGLDNVLAALDSHPNIEVRLFNPFLNRYWRSLGYLADFSRLNRRMHNKSLTADNQATILGGRNIGDEYFNISTDTSFSDLDILATGSVVTEVSQDFDRYWASDSAYPFDRIVRHGNVDKGFAELVIDDNEKNTVLARYYNDLEDSKLFKAINNKQVDWRYVKATLVSDDPAKALGRARDKPQISEKLDEALGSPEREIYLVSPYFVPTKEGTQAMAELVEEGVGITVLTNSLQATDVAAVHSGYARYRKPLIRAGVNLYELKANHAVPRSRDRGLTGNSSTSLHAKTFIVDKQRVFVGSFNLDPRSARLNTEMGVVIESPALAETMQQSLERTTPQYAYKVTMDKHHKLQWQDPEDGEVSNKEPEAGFWKRLTVKILSVLPIEKLL